MRVGGFSGKFAEEELVVGKSEIFAMILHLIFITLCVNETIYANISQLLQFSIKVASRIREYLSRIS